MCIMYELYFFVVKVVMSILPYNDKRKQLWKMTFPVNDQNVSVMRIDINALSLSLDLNIFQHDECSCSKLGMEVEYAKTSQKTYFLKFG